MAAKAFRPLLLSCRTRGGQLRAMRRRHRPLGPPYPWRVQGMVSRQGDAGSAPGGAGRVR